MARSCKNGADDTCRRAGRLLLKAGLAGENAERVVSVFRRSCRAGDVEGCRSLVDLHEKGGLAENLPRAARLSRQLCKRHEEAYYCGKYGMMRLRGRGVSRDGGDGLGYLRKGCVMGHEPSCRIVERMFALFEACDRGSASACLRLQKAFRGNM